MRRILYPVIGIFCLAIFLSLAGHVCAQKIMIPRMDGGGKSSSNILQVESQNGQPAKINFTFNYHKGEVKENGTTLYPMMHDEILYSLVGRSLTVNKNVHLSASGRQGQKKTVSLNALGVDLRSALNGFIQQVSRQTGGSGARGVAIMQVNNPAVENAAGQVRNLIH